MESKVDIWMPLVIGDYLADTSHLDTLQHGAYLLLLMHYWRKGPLPNDAAKLANIAKLPKDAWSMNEAVLMEFFTEGEDGLLHQKRSDREKEKWMKSRTTAQQKAAKAAKARWGDAPSIAPGNPQALPVQSPLPKPSPTNTKPKDGEQQVSKLASQQVSGTASEQVSKLADRAVQLDSVDTRILSESVGIFGMKEQAEMHRLLGKYCESTGHSVDLASQEMRGKWAQYQCAAPNLEWQFGSSYKFFMSAIWDKPEMWPLKGGGNAPKPKILSRPGE